MVVLREARIVTAGPLTLVQRMLAIGAEAHGDSAAAPAALPAATLLSAVIVMLLVGVIWRLQAHLSRWQQYNMVE